MKNVKSRSVTLNDVARHAKVSPMTVSRVINKGENVREKTVQKVLKSIKELNYKPNLSARALAGSRVYKIALLYANPSAFYLSELLVGALAEVSIHGHQLLVHKVAEPNFETDEQANLPDLIGQYDGVIVPAPLADSINVRSFLYENDIPAIYLSGLDVSGRSIKICIDDHAAVKEVMFKLIDLGHTRIGFIRGNPNQQSSADRFRGYQDALKDRNIPYNKELVSTGLYTFDSGRKAAEELLRSKNKPTAIFASNDDMAAATIAVAASQGLSVPEELSVVGFDDSPLASSVVPRLTTVRQPISDMAAEAIRKMITLIDPSKGEETVISGATEMAYKVIIGESISPPK